jgi:hypothetical protein
LHRVPEVAQPIDIAAHGANVDLQALRQIASGPLPPLLKQSEQRQQAGGSL